MFSSILPVLQSGLSRDIWDTDSSGMMAGSVSVQERFRWQQILFGAEVINFDWSRDRAREISVNQFSSRGAHIQTFRPILPPA
jgi:hypothetical protein